MGRMSLSPFALDIKCEELVLSCRSLTILQEV